MFAAGPKSFKHYAFHHITQIDEARESVKGNRAGHTRDEDKIEIIV
jgi:hypothetical protein